jgi:hypothetical protein
MERLIDANELIETFRRGFTSDVANAVASVINDAPTVDVSPVVHGEWIDEVIGYGNGLPIHTVWHCSEWCGCTIDDGTDDPDALPHYCPNCGAKMDADQIKSDPS